MAEIGQRFREKRRRNKMKTKYSNQLLVLVTVVGLMIGFQGTAHAEDWLSSLFGSNNTSNNNNNNNGQPDQKQVQADQNASAGFQQAIVQDDQNLAQAQQQLRQDQRAGVDTTADRQNIQNIINARNVDIGHLQSNAANLSKDGVANTYTIPTNPYNTNQRQGYYQGQGYQRPNGQYGQWTNQVPVPNPNAPYDPRDRRWDNRRHDENNRKDNRWRQDGDHQ